MRPITTTLLVLSLALAGCAGGGASPSPSAPASATPSAAPSAASSAPAGVVVTFAVTDEQYRIELTDPADIEIARRLLAGQEAPAIPNGLVVRGDPSVNVGYTWHIDPASVEFADVTTEVCDGKPSDVGAARDHIRPVLPLEREGRRDRVAGVRQAPMPCGQRRPRRPRRRSRSSGPSRRR